MPYRKKRGGYSGGGKKKAYKKNKTKQMVTGAAPTMVEQIASGVGQVAKLAGAVAPIIAAINTEHKYYDRTAGVTAYTPGTNDQIINLSGGIAQGLTDSTRVGNSILAKDIQLRVAHYFAATSTGVVAFGRFMLIVWKANAQENVLTAAKLFEAPTNIYSPLNKDYSDQIVVLKDKFVSYNSATLPTGAGYSASAQHLKIYKKLDFHMRFDGATASDDTMNHVYLIIRGSAASTNAVGATYYSRLNYTDN